MELCVEPAPLWPDRPADKLQTFFLAIAPGVDRSAAFRDAVRALKSVRWNDLGRYTARLPLTEPWIVVDWDGLLELPNEALDEISSKLEGELVALSAVVGHGRSTGHLFVKHLRSGKPQPTHTVETREDRVTPVSGDPDRLPSSFPVQDLPEFAAKLRLPENTLPADVPTIAIRCIPGRLAMWMIPFFLGGIAALLFT